MDYTIYECSLGIALVLMLFFAAYFLAAKTPDKPIFANYIRSRRIMGVALLTLSANYSVHLFCGLRFSHPDAAILMNLSTYFLSYWLFSSALTALLDRHYLTRQRFLRHLLYWLSFTILSGVILIVLPGGGQATLRTDSHGTMSARLWHLPGTKTHHDLPPCSPPV